MDILSAHFSLQTAVPTVEQLTSDQKKLLVRLVHCDQLGQLPHPIVPIPAGPMTYIIIVYGRDNLRLQRISDMDALCAVDLLSYRLNRMGNGKLYALTKAGRLVAQQWQHELVKKSWTAVDEVDHLRHEIAHRQTRLEQSLPPTPHRELTPLLDRITRQLEEEMPSRPQISLVLRRIGRVLAGHIYDETGAERMRLYAELCTAVYAWLDQP